MRVYQLAHELGTSSRELIDRLRADGEWVASHLSRVPEPHVRRLRATDSVRQDSRVDSPDSLVTGRPTDLPELSNPDKDERPLGREPWPPRMTPRLRRRPGPRPLSFQQPPVDQYDDPVENLRYEPELTTRDVADLLGVTPATVRMWVRRGHITPIGKYRNSNVFDTGAVRDAHDAIRSRTKSVGSSRRDESEWRLPQPAVNIPAKFHDVIVDVRQAAALAKVRPATIRTWIHRGHLQPLPSSQPREVRLRVGDVFKAARRGRRPSRPRRARLS